MGLNKELERKLGEFECVELLKEDVNSVVELRKSKNESVEYLRKKNVI